MKKIENLVIVAHPDDEALWFSSIIKKPSTGVVFCFQNMHLSNHDILNYTTKVFRIVELYRNKLGLPVIWLQTIRTLTLPIFGKIKCETKNHLKGNLHSLISVLEPKKIYTHNPWGE